MDFFKFNSIQKKLTFIIFVVAIAALLLSIITFYAYELHTYKISSKNELESVSNIIATHSIAALEFADPKTGNETLEPLKKNKNIAAAYILDEKGEVFASYIREDLVNIFDPKTKIYEEDLSSDYLSSLNTVSSSSNSNLGSIHLIADTKELKSHLLQYLYLMIFTFVIISLLIFLFSMRLQRTVSKPILNLAEIAKSLSIEKDYKKRFIRETEDEIGYLADKFNEMMTEVETRDDELEKARSQLENRVKERTKELEIEVEDRITAEKNLKFKTEYEQLLLKLSNHFINLSPERIDEGINNALFQIADFCDVERCYIYQFNSENNLLHCSHIWCNEEISHIFGINKDISSIDLPIFFKKNLEGEIVCINNLDELPNYANLEKQEFTNRGIRSIISVPLSFSGKNIGFLSFDSINKEVIWPDYIISLLSFSSEMLVNVIMRKQYLDQINESKMMLNLVMDNIPQAIFWKDTKSVYLGCNETFAKHAGLDNPKDIIGKTDYDLPWLRSESDTYLESERRVIDEVDPEYRVVQSQKQSEKKAIIEVNRVPLIGPDNQVFGVLGTYEDITDRSRMEHELIKTQKLESLGVLAGGIAHDFNNLLTGIIGSITLAQSELKSMGVSVKRLTDAENALYRARNLTIQLLTFAKGGQPIKRDIFISKLIEETTRLSLRGSNVKSEIHLSEDLWPVEADEGQLSQAINNLIINADQSMENGGIVKIYGENVSVESDTAPLNKGNYVKLIIQDEGCGIPKENLSKIFDPYFTTKKYGHGLGLATTYSIIKKHNGHINVKSDVDIGTIIEVYLKAASNVDILVEDDLNELKVGAGNILLMEDDDFIRQIAGDLLKEIGYKVELATNGFDAINLFKNAIETGNEFDAVILDLTIPGSLGGKDTVEKLLKIDPSVKAIVSTGYYNDSVIANYKDYGFVDLIPKPYKAKDLSDVLFRVIEG